MIYVIKKYRLSSCIFDPIKNVQIIIYWLMLAQLNRLRTDPSSLQKQLEERKNYINQNNLLFSPNHPNKSIKTKEGRLPINELIGQLYNDRQLKQLKQSAFLNECALYIAESYSRENIDEQIFLQNISRQIRNRIDANYKQSFERGVKCLIGVGFKEEGEPLFSVVIDDGDKERKKRKMLLGNNYQFCGVGCYPLSDPSLICGVYLLANQRAGQQ